jgi:DNA-binding HxlR family transcriptional regulator
MDDPTIAMTGALEPREAWQATRCSVARTLDVVRTRSAFLILREAFYGARRFDEFAARTGLSEPVTATRLRELTDEGLLERVPYREPGSRTRSGYRLTEAGADLLPVVVALMQWGDRWRQDRGAPVEIRHSDCGGRVRAALLCEHGHELDPGAGDLELVRPPGAGRLTPA